MQTLRIVNYVIALIFTICYAYQFFYIPVVLFRKKIFRRKEKAAAQGTAAEKACEFAVLICARKYPQSDVSCGAYPRFRHGG